MELYKEILTNILARGEPVVFFPKLKEDISSVIESECYKALQKIKTIVENDSLDDFECVEQIVCVFESIGSNGGGRHDFR